MSVNTWKDITGFPNYQASSCGKIRVLQRRGQDGRILKGRELRQSTSSGGYKLATIQVGSKSLQKPVHCLVALAHIGDKPYKFDVDHLNGKRNDNRAINLEYVSRRENIIRSGVHTGRVNAETHYPGVNYNPMYDAWESRLTYKSETISLGCYKGWEDAYAARKRCEDKIDHYEGEILNILKDELDYRRRPQDSLRSISVEESRERLD